MAHTHAGGAIVSLATEVSLPSGDEDGGLGKGTAVVEPYVAFGKTLPGDGFFQLQAGFELPVERDLVRDEAFLRAAIGRSFAQGQWGRSWSPMVEILGQVERGGETHWDALPQVQVSLSTRQHVLVNAGVRLPLNSRAERDVVILFYLLWDWFDGGFFDGW
jgi:hypothetical protein